MTRRLFFVLAVILAIPASIFAQKALIDAATNGDAAFIKNYKGDINKRLDDNNSTALILAAQNGNTDVVKVLITAKADVNAEDNDGETALSMADNEDITDLLKNSGAKQTLISAAKYGDIEFIKSYKDDVNAGGASGFTALMKAAEEGQTDSIQALLAVGAKVDVKTKDNWTALMCAADEGQIDSIEALLAAKADVSVTDSDGNSALSLAKEKKHPDVVKLLKNAGAE
jgi:hypothetical protein